MSTILTVATILGGLAALWFFWDKIRSTKASVPEDQSQPQVAYITSDYVENSGLGPRLRAEGYRLRWSGEDKVVQRTELEGWERVVEETPDGRRRTLHQRDFPTDQILLRKRDHVAD